MKHTLVLPCDLNDKLYSVASNASVLSRWTSIGVKTINDMLLKIIDDMNNTFYKLNITDVRFEGKNVIRSKISNLGKESVYAGYLEADNGVIDGLFFYIPPSLDSANDILSRQVIPGLMGIFSGVYDSTKDLHLTNRPIYIVNLNELSRMNQRSVKINIIFSKLMGFNYLDLFGNEYEDIITDDFCDLSNNIEMIDDLITDNGTHSNDYFVLDPYSKTLKVLANKLNKSKNPTAEIYRFILKVVPSIYIGLKEGYTIDISDLNTITNDIDSLKMMKIHILKLLGG